MVKRKGALSEKYNSTHGTWQVTTEGDVEGRTTANLGTFTGWIDEIALWLANKSYYTLNFKKLDAQNAIVGAPTRKSVSVTLDIDSNTWGMTPDTRSATMAEIFARENRPVTISNGTGYASFNISTDKETAEDRLEKIKKTVKEQLSATDLVEFGDLIDNMKIK